MQNPYFLERLYYHFSLRSPIPNSEFRIPNLLAFLFKKGIQLTDTAKQIVHLLLGEFLSDGVEHLLVEIAMETVHLAALTGQLDDGHAGVLFTAGLGDVALLDQLIHADRHGGHRHVQGLGDLSHGAAVILPLADALQGVELGNTELPSSDVPQTLLLHPHNGVEGIHKEGIQFLQAVIHRPSSDI